jgi:hypothetical protein
MFNAIGDSLSIVAYSVTEENGEDGEYDEDDTVVGKLIEGHQPGWIIGTISKPVLYRMERYHSMQMRLDKVMQQALGDSADFFPK